MKEIAALRILPFSARHVWWPQSMHSDFHQVSTYGEREKVDAADVPQAYTGGKDRGTLRRQA